MKCKLLLLSLVLLTGSQAKAQIRCADDPDITIDMDIEAKSKSAILKLSTYSRTSQMSYDAYVVITFMNDSIQKLVGRAHNDNKGIETDTGHGFADRFVSRSTLNLTPEQAEMFKYGMKSIQIRMLPKTYFKEWKSDELGIPLYQRYLTSKENVMFKKKKKESQ
jgi:hypothetical protein